jgi:hypothetical protein
MINPLVIIVPALFGCSRVSLAGIVGDPGLQRLLVVLAKLGAKETGEAWTPADELGNYYFKLQGKWVVLVVEEFTAIQVIAPPVVIGSIQNELGRWRYQPPINR